MSADLRITISLLTSKETAHGVPFSKAEWDLKRDHNYYSKEQVEEFNTYTVLEIEKKYQNLPWEHTSSKQNESNVSKSSLVIGQGDKPWIPIGVCAIISAIFIFLGIGLMSTTSYYTGVVINYRNATLCDNQYQNITCQEVRAIKKNALCSCYKEFEIEEDIPGPVSLFSELPSFNFDKMAKSRDDAQLSGNLTNPPSEACGNFSYDNDKPIAPCGQLADAYGGFDMFSVNLRKDNISALQYNVTSGILTESEKARFHNPPGDLNVAFQNYTKPKSWTDMFWTKFLNDAEGVNNSAFQNERFIGYMTESIKRKPYGIIVLGDNTPVPLEKGKYALQISYKNYDYYGDRLFIISSPMQYNYSKYNAGVAILVIGLVVAAGTLFLSYIVFKRQVDKPKPSESAETERMRT